MQEKNKDKIEARFAERKQKTNSLKIKFLNVKRKLNNMEQVLDGILRNGYFES